MEALTAAWMELSSIGNDNLRIYLGAVTTAALHQKRDAKMFPLFSLFLSSCVMTCHQSINLRCRRSRLNSFFWLNLRLSHFIQLLNPGGESPCQWMLPIPLLEAVMTKNVSTLLVKTHEFYLSISH